MTRPALGEKPDEPPGAKQTKSCIQGFEQMEGRVGVREHKEPQACDPCPKGRMLVVPNLTLLSPRVGFEHVPMQRSVCRGDRPIQSPRRDEKEETGGNKEVLPPRADPHEPVIEKAVPDRVARRNATQLTPHVKFGR